MEENPDEPQRWPEPRWNDDLRRAEDALCAEALARYIEGGHPYHMALRSPNAVKWIEQGQYVFFARVDDSSTYWRLQRELKRARQ